LLRFLHPGCSENSCRGRACPTPVHQGDGKPSPYRLVDPPQQQFATNLTHRASVRLPSSVCRALYDVRALRRCLWLPACHETFASQISPTGGRDGADSPRAASAPLGSCRTLPRTAACSAFRNAPVRQPSAAVELCKSRRSMHCLQSYSPKHCPGHGNVFCAAAQRLTKMPAPGFACQNADLRSADFTRSRPSPLLSCASTLF